jgi:streptogramin lyase
MNDDITIDPTMRAVAAQYFDRVENRPLPRSLTLAAPSLHSARRGFRLVRGLAAVAVFVAISAALTIVILVTRNLAATSPAHPQAPQRAPSLPTFSTSVCGVWPRPTPTTGIAEYPVPGVDNMGPAVTGSDGNVWFIGGASNGVNGAREVVGRVTPAGKITIYSIPGNPGESFDGIAAGPGGDVWFSVSTGDTIGRLAPATGHIDLFPVHVPPVSASAKPVRTETTDMVAGPDGNLWFDVSQVAANAPATDGQIGRITPTGVITLFALPGSGRPEGIQVGADGNLYSRIAVEGGAMLCGAIPGYSPSAEVVRTTLTGKVTELSEDSPQFAGYTIGPDGNHWWMTSKGTMRRTTPSGQVKNFRAYTTLGFWDPAHFVFGPDKNIWYVDGGVIDRMTLAGHVTLYQPPGTVSDTGVTWITDGPDGRLWFTDGLSMGNIIGAIRPPSGQVG